MADPATANIKVAVTTMGQCVVVTMPARLSADVLDGVRAEVLQRLKNSSLRVVILDMSLVGAIDRREFCALADIVRMVRLMGTPALFSGMRPGAVSALVDLDADITGLDAVLNVDEALARFEPAQADAVGDPETDEPLPDETPPTGGN